jgi:hypothetical protein
VGERVIEKMKETLIEKVVKSFPNFERTQTPIKYKQSSIPFFFKGVEVVATLLSTVQWLLPANIDYLIL